MNPHVQVAVGVLIDDQGRILLAKRHADAHQGDLWEFPGGKVESGETTTQALQRELYEELGVRVTQSRPLIRVLHHYDDLSVELDVCCVTAWSGEPEGKEGQPLQWVGREALVDISLPAANVPIVTALRLPSHYLITPAQFDGESVFLERLERALKAGYRLFQLRLFDIAESQLLALAAQAQQLCSAYGAQLLFNGDVSLASRSGVGGLHLNSQQLHSLDSRPTGFDWVAASCHSVEDLQQAQRLALDFCVLSPVQATASHPDASPLGWERFAVMREQVNLPVYALGGMTPEMLAKAWAAGAQGVAGIRGLWPDDES